MPSVISRNRSRLVGLLSGMVIQLLPTKFEFFKDKAGNPERFPANEVLIKMSDIGDMEDKLKSPLFKPKLSSLFFFEWYGIVQNPQKLCVQLLP